MRRNTINIYVCTPVMIVGQKIGISCLYHKWGLKCQLKCPFKQN